MGLYSLSHYLWLILFTLSHSHYLLFTLSLSHYLWLTLSLSLSPLPLSVFSPVPLSPSLSFPLPSLSLPLVLSASTFPNSSHFLSFSSLSISHLLNLHSFS